MSYRGQSIVSCRIDEKIQGVLLSVLHSALNSIRGDLSEKFDPECNLLIQLGFYYAAFGISNTSPGMKAVRLAYHPDALSERSIVFRKYLVAFTIILDYTRQRIKIWHRDALYSLPPGSGIGENQQQQHDRRNSETTSSQLNKLGRALAVSEVFVKLARIANYLAFLRSGSYPTLLHRIAGLSLVPIVDEGGEVDHEVSPVLHFMRGREILWLALSECITASTGAISWRNLSLQLLQSRLQGAWRTISNSTSALVGGSVLSALSPPSPSPSPSPSSSISNINEAGAEAEIQEGVTHTHTHTHANANIDAFNYLCTLCSCTPEAPQVTACGHLYCYYCIRRTAQITPFNCMACGQESPTFSPYEASS